MPLLHFYLMAINDSRRIEQINKIQEEGRFLSIYLPNLIKKHGCIDDIKLSLNGFILSECPTTKTKKTLVYMAASSIKDSKGRRVKALYEKVVGEKRGEMISEGFESINITKENSLLKILLAFAVENVPGQKTKKWPIYVNLSK